MLLVLKPYLLRKKMVIAIGCEHMEEIERKKQRPYSSLPLCVKSQICIRNAKTEKIATWPRSKIRGPVLENANFPGVDLLFDAYPKKFFSRK